MIARRRDRLQEVARAIEVAGGAPHVFEVDARDSARLARAIDDFAVQQGRLDVLVNNAGYGYRERVADADPDEWRTEVEVNLIAPMYATSAAVAHMIAAGHGHIVNVSSMASRGPTSHGAGYAQPRRPD